MEPAERIAWRSDENLFANKSSAISCVGEITSTKMSKTSEMTEATKPAAKNAAQPTMAEVV